MPATTEQLLGSRPIRPATRGQERIPGSAHDPVIRQVKGRNEKVAPASSGACAGVHGLNFAAIKTLPARSSWYIINRHMHFFPDC